jgi:hypothetical protein
MTVTIRLKADVEAEKVRDRLEEMLAEGSFPEKPVISRFEVLPDYDWTGHPSYYITVYLDPSTTPRFLKREKTQPIHEIVFENVFEGTDERWPYISIVRQKKARKKPVTEQE